MIAVRDCEDGMEAELEKAVGDRLKAVWAAAVKPEVRLRCAPATRTVCFIIYTYEHPSNL